MKIYCTELIDGRHFSRFIIVVLENAVETFYYTNFPHGNRSLRIDEHMEGN